MIPRLIAWHYSQGLKNLLEAWRNFCEFFMEYFSVVRFMKTLLSPWRRDVSRVMRRGFHPILLLQALIENVFTRIIGAIVKSAVIIMAVILELIALVLGLFLVIIWVSMPLAFLISLGEIMFSGSQENYAVIVFWVITFLSSAAFMVVSLSSFRSEKKDYFSMDLVSLSHERWFERVWNRMNLVGEMPDEKILGDQEAFKKYLNDLDLSVEDFSKILDWEIRMQIDLEKKKKFWSRENLLSRMPIGRNWAYAYTVNLDRHSRDLSEADYTEYRNAELIGKEKELEELQLILTKPSQNNAIIVGEPGVGRDTIIHTLARNIRRHQSAPSLENKRILEIDLKEVLSNYGAEEGDAMLQSLFSEATYAGNIILVVKDIHDFLASDSGEGKRDISSILSEYLSYPTFQLIGTTTPGEFHAKIEKKSGIMKYCDKLWIDEMTKEDALLVMLYKLKETEKNGILITYQGLKEIINLADRYVNDSPFPEKALDLMEEVVLHWSSNAETPFVSKPEVDKAVSSKIKVPLGEIASDEGKKLLDLEDILHHRVVGQNLAISQIAETVRRTRVGMMQKDKPLGSFLFLGPTGVGKTESSKALAEAYFGDENRMIRLDMSEYQAADSIDRIIGSMETGREGFLISKVKESPYSLLLLDEIEKAYPDILNLFLQILDEGYLTDAFGKKISFRNLIIIATSNAGSDIIKECIEADLSPEDTKKKLIDHVISKGIFKAELLNRFEGVVFFHPLTPDDIMKVTDLILRKYAGRIKEQENIDLSFAPGVAEKIAQEAFDPIFGARAINRFVQDKIEDGMVKRIISGDIKKGSAYIFQLQDLG